MSRPAGGRGDHSSPTSLSPDTGCVVGVGGGVGGGCIYSAHFIIFPSYFTFTGSPFRILTLTLSVLTCTPCSTDQSPSVYVTRACAYWRVSTPRVGPRPSAPSRVLLGPCSGASCAMWVAPDLMLDQESA